MSWYVVLSTQIALYKIRTDAFPNWTPQVYRIREMSSTYWTKVMVF